MGEPWLLPAQLIVGAWYWVDCINFYCLLVFNSVGSQKSLSSLKTFLHTAVYSVLVHIANYFNDLRKFAIRILRQQKGSFEQWLFLRKNLSISITIINQTKQTIHIHKVVLASAVPSFSL